MADTLRDASFEIEPIDVVPDGGDLLPPPPPPEEPPRRPDGPRGWRGRRQDEPLFSHGTTLAIVLLHVALYAVAGFALTIGAQGGQAAAWFAIVAFAVLFLGPFIGGALWFGAQRDH